MTLVFLVPASDERLANALYEYSRHGITNTGVIKQYLAKDLGIEMSYVSPNSELVLLSLTAKAQKRSGLEMSSLASMLHEE